MAQPVAQKMNARAITPRRSRDPQRSTPQHSNPSITQPEKLLPQNVQAEASVLGSLLIDPEAVTQVADFLRPEDFYRESHRVIFQAVVELHENGEPSDSITLTDDLQRRGKLEEVGGVSYVTSLANNVPTSANIVYYARIVKRYSVKRRLIQASGHIAAAAYGDDDISLALDMAERLLGRVRDSASSLGHDDLYPILTDEEAEAIPPAVGILGDILYEACVAILYGPSGRWKSFLALSWALCIATGHAWMGRAVKSGDVIYIAAEGGRGIGKRITAAKLQYGITGRTRLHPLLVPVSLLDASQVDRLIRSIRKLVGDSPVLIVIDTLSRSMPGGDENLGKDGSRAFAAADRLRQAFEGVTVLLVAHPGKNEENGIRGWSGYFQWADIVMRVFSRDNKPRLDVGDVVTLTSEKPKDTEPFDDITLSTVRREWVAEDGHGVSSLVIVPSAKSIGGKEGDMPNSRRLVLEAVVAHGPEGVHPNELERELVGKVSRSSVFAALSALRVSERVLKNDDTGIYFAAPLASPNGPVQSKISPIGPRATSPVQSNNPIGVGLDWTAPAPRICEACGGECSDYGEHGVCCLRCGLRQSEVSA